MFKNLKKRNEGFTIIEVLIVLAIAGLIMLIVFLAVPALQRNSRNTSIKSDVANVLGGVSEYEAANSGALPTTITSASGVVTYGALTGTTAKVNGSTTVGVVVAVPAAGTPAIGTISVYLGHNCAGTVNARAAAAYYSIEAGASGTATQQCQDS